MAGEGGGGREEEWRAPWTSPPGTWSTTTKLSRNISTLTTFPSPHSSRCYFSPPLRKGRLSSGSRKPRLRLRLRRPQSQQTGRPQRIYPTSAPSVARCSASTTGKLSSLIVKPKREILFVFKRKLEFLMKLSIKQTHNTESVSIKSTIQQPDHCDGNKMVFSDSPSTWPADTSPSPPQKTQQR